MGMVTRAKRRRTLEEEEEHHEDRISNLPDGVLGDIVSLLPTRDCARTQVLSSRWRHLWRSAPLNLDFRDDPVGICASDISRILSAHLGPGRRFLMPRVYRGMEYPTTTATLDGWLRSPGLDNVQELELRFNDLLFPAIGRGHDAAPPHWPLLKQLTLYQVSILESSLHALLAGCPVLESLLLLYNRGFSRLQIVSRSLRSIGVCSSHTQQLVIEDAPCLERLLYFGGPDMNISVICAPRLAILGNLFDGFPRLQFGATVFQGSAIVSSTSGGVVSSVKVLALHDVNLSLDAVINLLQCFPRLHKLYIDLSFHTRVARVSGKDWCIYRKLTSALDIGLRKIVLRNYRGNKSHVNLARFFVSNATVLELMRLRLKKAQNLATNGWEGNRGCSR